MNLTIESAHTGDVLPPLSYEAGFDQLRSELSLMSSIPAPDQILLCGPPFKTLKSMYTDIDQLRGKRIFLYDRRVCVDAAFCHPIDHVKLTELKFDNQTEPPSEPLFENGNDMPKLEVLTKYLRANLAREVQYEAYMKAQYSTIQKSVGKHKIQMEAVSAAIDNVYENCHKIFGPYNEYKIKMSEILAKHKSLLESFDSNLDLLAKCNLHPHFVKLKRGEEDQGPPLTLIDTIDYERIKSVRSVSHENYKKMEKFSTKLENTFKSIMQRIDELRASVKISETLGSSLKDYQQLIANQELKVQLIRKDYQELSTSLKPSSSKSEGTENFRRFVNNYLQYDHQWSKDHAEKNQRLLDLAKLCDQSSMDMSNMVNTLMRSIALIQSEVQWRIPQDVENMRKLTTTSPNENIRQLEVIANLPKFQIIMLEELCRRQNYETTIMKKIKAFKDEMNELRTSETQNRKEFMDEHGSLLPPFFYELVPSLRSKPDFVDVAVSSCGIDTTMLPIKMQDIVNFVEELPSDFMDLKAQMSQRLQIDSNKLSADDVSSVQMMMDRQEDQDVISANTELSTCIRRVETSEKSIQNAPELVVHSGVQVSGDEKLSQLEEENQILKMQLAELQSILDNQSTLDTQQLNASSIATSGSQMEQEVHSGGIDIVEKKNQALSSSSELSVGQLIPWLQYVSVVLDNNRLSMSQFIKRDDFSLYAVQSSFDESRTVGNQIRLVTARMMALYHDYLNLTKFSMLSFLNFEVGNLALFMPTDDNPKNPDQVTWVAFSCNCPHRYLAKESLEYFLKKKKGQIGYLIGKISKIEELVVDEKSTAEVNLSIGSKYYVVYARPVKFPSISSSSSSSKQHAT